MSDHIERVDACGLSCPQPVLLTRNAINKVNKGTIEVMVDSGASRDNVSRLARNSGWTVAVEEQPGGIYRVLLQK
jgi:tRNA 2-thiouridine synthesizing protein A